MVDTHGRIESYIWRVSAVVVLGSTMSTLDTTIVNVALATLGRDLHSSITQIQWVVTAYMLALAAVIPVSGWAADRFGARRMYVISLAMFTVGSMLCGMSRNTGELVAFRVLQGVGGGMIVPLGQMMVASAAGPKRMGRVWSVLAVPIMLPPILGPTVGGFILQNTSWRWIFYVNVPIGVVTLIAAIRVLPDVKTGVSRALDWRGLALMATGVPLVTYGLAEIGTTGRLTSIRAMAPCLIGSVLVTFFALHALRTPQPLLNLRLYRRPTFSSASAALFLLGAALFGGMILMPLYWQAVRHESVIETGLLVGPQGLGAALAMPFAGRLTERMGGGVMALFGVLLTTASTIPLGLIGAHTSIIWLCTAMFLRGIGLGFAFMPAMTAAYAALERSEIADASPQLIVLQRVGGSLGTAVLAVVLQRALAGAHSVSGAAAAYGMAFWAAAALAAVAVVPCVILLRAERDARARRSEVFADSKGSSLEGAAA